MYDINWVASYTILFSGNADLLLMRGFDYKNLVFRALNWYNRSFNITSRRCLNSKQLKTSKQNFWARPQVNEQNHKITNITFRSTKVLLADIDLANTLQIVAFHLHHSAFRKDCSH
jgi:hypothetical protein